MALAPRTWLLPLVGLALLLQSSWAQAAVRLCVVAKASQQEAFESLLTSEIRRHPSHEVVREACEARLVAEVFSFSGRRYLTVQIEGGLPIRKHLGEMEDVSSKLGQAVTEALGNDPAHLASDPVRWSAMSRASHQVLVHGVNQYRLELFETSIRTDRNMAFAPGVAMSFARGADRWEVGARLHCSGIGGEAFGKVRTLPLLGGMDLGLTYFSSKTAMTSGFIGAGLGVSLLRIEGLSDPEQGTSRATVDTTGAVMNIRGGLRFMRIFDFAAEAFLQVSLPLFATHETDVKLFGERGIYTPYLQLGVGAGF